jgi:hypothetical protein
MKRGYLVVRLEPIASAVRFRHRDDAFSLPSYFVVGCLLPADWDEDVNSSAFGATGKHFLTV